VKTHKIRTHIAQLGLGMLAAAVAAVGFVGAASAVGEVSETVTISAEPPGVWTTDASEPASTSLSTWRLNPALPMK
jgi:hypothetical protein